MLQDQRSTRANTLGMVLILLGLVAFSAFVGWSSPQLLTSRRLLLVVAGVLGLAGTLAVLVRPALGLYAAFVLSITLRLEIGTGTQTGINIAFILAAGLVGIWLLRMVGGGNLRLKPSLLNLPALLLVLAFGVALLSGQVGWDYTVAGLTSIQVQVVQVLIIWLSIGLMFFGGNTLGEAELKRLVALFLVLAGLIVVNAFLARAGVPFLFVMTVGMFPSWVVALAISLALVHDGLPSYLRGVLGMLAIAWLAWALTDATTLASAWVPPMVALLAVAFFHSRRLFLALLVAGILVTLWRPETVTAIIAAGTGGGTELRVDLWTSVTELAAKSPITGLGPANYRPYALSSIVWNPEMFGSLPDYARDAPSHNQYVDILGQAGILGLVPFLWLLAAVAVEARRLYRRAVSPFVRSYGLAVLGACAAVLVIGVIGDWVLPYVYNIGLRGFRQSIFTWVFIGGLLVLANPDTGQASAEAPDEMTEPEETVT